jgi:arsenite methyltransferase
MVGEMPENSPFSYFEIQALMGTTKHMGGLEATRELIAICRIQEGQTILDVGCGVGATAVYLVKEVGCRVAAVDIRESMVSQAKRRAKREGLGGQLEFQVASAISLPFGSSIFEVVLCESVLTFVREKERAICEMARVIRPGGCLGLNEETWLKSPPPQELVDFTRRTWDIGSPIPSLEGWTELMQSCGLRDIAAHPHPFSAARESSQFRRYRVGDFIHMITQILRLYLTSPDFRQYMSGRTSSPKNLFEYLGYGLYVSRK